MNMKYSKIHTLWKSLSFPRFDCQPPLCQPCVYEVFQCSKWIPIFSVWVHPLAPVKLVFFRKTEKRDATSSPQKFNSSPLESHLSNRKGSSSNHHLFFRGELFNFGGVGFFFEFFSDERLQVQNVRALYTIIPQSNLLQQQVPKCQMFYKTHLF